MTILEQHKYRNPLDVLIEEESRTCKGCGHEHSEKLWGQLYTVCKKVLPNGKRRHHGKRCKDYQEGK
ncbi:MAG: hypothetical protein JWO08_3088 [Verrucomicrobiaceae bacterium]|nr:hypothetical protein [Verrucomicrobiaceae bacterium]